MNQEEIRLVALESNGVRYEEQISDSQSLTFSSFLNYLKANRVDFNEEKYVTFGLRRLDGRFTNLGLLFSDQNPIVVKLAVYNGFDRIEFKIKKEFEGSLTRIIDELLSYVKIVNDKRIIKPDGGTWKRTEILSYPEKSLREAILNSIEHANYHFLSNIKVEFFDDRVEISNPGNFYGGITLEQALKGKQSFRNPKLVYALDKLGFVENYATGLTTIFDEYKGFGKQPKFDIFSTHTTVIMFNINYDYYASINQNVGVNVGVKLSKTEEAVIGLIKDNLKITSDEMAVKLGKTKRTIERCIASLKDKGLLIRIESDKNGHWEEKAF